MSKRLFVLMIWGTAFINTAVQAYDWLYVQHPQQTWRGGTGTIEEAVVSIRPAGLYMEYGLYLTFSGRDLGFSATDSVEVQFFFDLPKEAIVHDLWLWVGEDIVRAKLLDRWTASSIYEDIVRRRRDPAILFKNSPTQYELRIYPMKGNEQRKIKLTYLAPTQWSPNAVSAALPLNLIRTSKYPVDPLYLLYWEQTDWQNPRLKELPEISFEAFSDTTFGEYLRADVPYSSQTSSLSFALDSPMRDGVFVNRSQSDNEGIYQLALLPSQALQLQTARKVAILFDYEASKTDLSAAAVLNGVRSMLHEQFTAADSFNLIFSSLNIKRAGEDWFAGDSLSIENAFSSAGQDPLASYSNLPALLANAIDFVKTNSNDGFLWLISSSDHVGDYRVANPLINDLLKAMDPILPIYVSDYSNSNQQYFFIGNRYYLGNEYFYVNLTQRTYGNYLNIREIGSFSVLLNSIAETLSGFIESFDLYTTLQGGFCFGRHNLNPIGTAIFLDRPILQVGKYNGDFPFIVQTSGVYKAQPFSRTTTVESSSAQDADSLAAEIWTGNYISALETQPESNEIIGQIINASLDERVLSRYTAFLALEPGDTVEVCIDCQDESDVVISVDDRNITASDSLLLRAYPNPFNAETTINLNLPAGLKAEDMSLKIYNLLGQVVRTFPLAPVAQSERQQIKWDGRNEAGEAVATGVYYVIFRTPVQKATSKLVMVK